VGRGEERRGGEGRGGDIAAVCSVPPCMCLSVYAGVSVCEMLSVSVIVFILLAVSV